MKPLITRETAGACDIFYNLKPLFWALSYGAEAEVLKALLDAHPEAAKEKHPTEGWTPLHYVEKLSLESVRLLLATCPEAAHELDREGSLPLHWAAEHNAPKEVLQLLLKANGSAAERRDGFGRLPSRLAQNAGASEEVLQLLRAAAPAAFASVAPKDVEPIGLLFPGPGSEYVGMLRDVQDLPEIQAMLSEAQRLLGFDLLQVCLHGPEGSLKEDPTRSHPALFVGGLAAHRKLLNEKPAAGNFQATAGFSVGGITALTAAGVFSFSDGLSLVLERAKAVQEVVKLQDQATVSVTGLDEAKVQDLCRKAVEAAAAGEVCQVSGYLHKRGFLVGGTKLAMEGFQKLAKSARAMQVTLCKGQSAVHTVLMKPARERFKAKLRDFLPRMSRPRCTIFMSSRPVDWNTDPEIVLELLSEELALPLKWKESVEALGRVGLEDLFECGPSKELKAILKRIDADVWSRTCNVEV